jgi:ATP-dependent Clp protease ATP-binding subunit ClpC
MAELCDLCGVRPATVRARVTRNGETEVLNLCEVDYRRLAARQRSASPLESLFGGRSSLFDDFFGDAGGFGGRSDGESRSFGELPARAATRRTGEPEDRLSEHAKDLLQTAAERAVG